MVNLWDSPGGDGSSEAYLESPSLVTDSRINLVTMQAVAEDKFREAVRTLIAQGRYPDHSKVCDLVGIGYTHSGFTDKQTLWRREEVTAAGYDFEASKKSGRLVRKG